jgi:uncharacterized paraquat-inducible protein A
MSSSQEGSAVSHEEPHDPHHRPRACPGCGQRVDAANVRCPRCRRWFVPPPTPPRRRRLAVVLAVALLAAASFLAGAAMHGLWSPVPPEIVLPEAPVGVKGGGD